jgi:hypothetical protein
LNKAKLETVTSHASFEGAERFKTKEKKCQK